MKINSVLDSELDLLQCKNEHKAVGMAFIRIWNVVVNRDVATLTLNYRFGKNDGEWEEEQGWWKTLKVAVIWAVVVIDLAGF